MATADAQQLADITKEVAAGGLLAGLLAFIAGMRKHIGLPKRVRCLEDTQALILQSQSAQTEALLAMLETRRVDQHNDHVNAAKTALREAKAEMTKHMAKQTSGGHN